MAESRLTQFTGRALAACVSPPVYGRLIGQQMLRIGYFSLPVVGLTAFFTGGALALQIYLGGNESSTRLNRLFKDTVKTDDIEKELRPLLGRYANERLAGERFGDWCERVLFKDPAATQN